MTRRLTIHKAQGQTLERVKVDVGKHKQPVPCPRIQQSTRYVAYLLPTGDAFEKGQVYVALSRATQLVRRTTRQACWSPHRSLMRARPAT